MRPALEDVLLFLEFEFAINVVPGWRKVVDEHLREWREVQMMSAVRDSPLAAARVLEQLGFTVEPPKVVSQRPDPAQNKLFWP
jgi:hypothetical protein